MSLKSNKSRLEDDRGYVKKVRKQDMIRPSSFLPPSQCLGRHHRAASISATSHILEKDVIETQNIEYNNIKSSDVDSGQTRGRKTRRANSLPTSSSKRYLIEGGSKSARLGEGTKYKISHNVKEKRRDVESERLHHQRMSLDLSQMSDYADSECEHKDRFSKHHSRRRRSAEKSSSRVEKISSQLAVRSVSNSPSSKVTCAHESITRRRSLQNFTPKSSYDPVLQNTPNRDVKNQGIRRRTSSAMFIRKASLGSNMMRKSEFIFSSESPDNTSDVSPSELSPRKKRASLSPLPSKIFSESKVLESVSNRTVRSSNYQLSNIKSNRGEADKSRNETTPGKERGEWNSFWQNYNSSLAVLPKRFFYDDCPTPFYEPTSNGGIKVFDVSCKQPECQKEEKHIDKPSKKMTKEMDKSGINLSNSEAKEIIYCSRKLAEILSCAVERQTSSKTKKYEKLENGRDGGNKSAAEESVRTENKVGDSARDVFL